MFKKLFASIMLVLFLLLLVSCGKGEDNGNNIETQKSANSTKVLSVEEYMSSLSVEQKKIMSDQTNLLLHPLKDAVDVFGEDYEFSWEGNYVKLTFSDAKCSFEAYAGAEFEHYDWHNNYIEYDDCNVMEYLSYAIIERVIFDGEGLMLTDGISIGMSARQIAEQLNVAGIEYLNSDPIITTEYDSDGKVVNVYHIPGQINTIDYIVVFAGDILSRVEIANYSRYLFDEVTVGDNGRQIINEAVSFVSENGLAMFDADDLSYRGQIYSSYFDSWFYGWEFMQGDYKGCVINVEQNAPNRVYISSYTDGQPILFWCNGEYVDPMLSFIGKWRYYNSKEYIDIKSISKEGIVVFDMYTEVNLNTYEMILLENLSTVINNIPKDLDAYLLAEYAGEALGGDIQIFNGEVQSGYYIYGEKRFYLIDSFWMDLNGSVSYMPRSLWGRVGTGSLSIHIPNKEIDYSQKSTWGYMENFGRDDLNVENILFTNQPNGDFVINNYLNDFYQTTGLKYAGLEYRYLYDYVFPVNDVTYNVWESIDTESPHYLYIDSANEFIIKECQLNSISKHSKELIYKAGTIVDSKSYANQRFTTPDGKIVVDLVNRTITKKDSFIDDIKLPVISHDTVGKNDRFMFFCDIGTRFALNGYVLFDHTTWGATLHITDSNVPGFDIGVYYLSSETFFLDPSIGVIGIPEESEGDKYLDDKIEEIGQETKLVIRQFGGQIIGYIYVDAQGNKTVKNFYGKILGYYHADRDVTTDYAGKIIAWGDATSALLFI